MRPETLGVISSCGLASHHKVAERSMDVTMYEVHRVQYLDPRASGRDKLLQLAATAVIAAMADLLRRGLEPPCPECDNGMAINGACFRCLNCGTVAYCR